MGLRLACPCLPRLHWAHSRAPCKYHCHHLSVGGELPGAREAWVLGRQTRSRRKLGRNKFLLEQEGEGYTLQYS